MREKRFLRVLLFSLILGLGILLCINLLSFEFSGHNPLLAEAQINPNIRTSSFYFGYPTSYLGGLGTGLYPGLGVGLMPGLGLPPISQQVSLAQVTPLTSSTLDSSYYRDPVTMYGTQARTFTNPFATYGSTAMQYADPFSQAAANTMSYNNIFGVSLEAGQGFYRDPFYATGGKYINYSSPVSGFSSDMAYSMSPVGGTTHLGSSLTTPWTHISTDINRAYGPGAAGASIGHVAIGVPTVFNMAGFHPAVAGQLALMTYGSETAAMDRALGNTYAYTREGMPYIPVASYYNANSVGGTNYFFAGDISYQEAGAIGAGPFTTGYNVVQEVPSSLVPLAGLGIASGAGLSSTAFAGWVGDGAVATSPYGGWTGGAASSDATGSIYAGWGISGGAVFGTTSAGAWGGGFSGGFTGSGAVGGGTFTGGASGATYGGTNVGW
jgi:hypothetical protein